MASKEDVPSFDQLIAPTLSALHRLGGSASIQELVDDLTAALGLPAEIAEVPHGRGSQTELEYRAAWARTYLRNADLVENSDRGVWSLTSTGAKTKSVDGRALARQIQKRLREARLEREDSEVVGAEESAVELVRSIREAHYASLKDLSPGEKIAFFREKARALHAELGRHGELPDASSPAPGVQTRR